MPYPDNFSQSAFDRTWGSSVSPSELILDADIERVHQAVINAFKMWPLDDLSHQDQRRAIITNELNRLDRNMESQFLYQQGEKGQHLIRYAGICAAIHTNERRMVEDMVSDYVFFWKNKLEQSQQEGEAL